MTVDACACVNLVFTNRNTIARSRIHFVLYPHLQLWIAGVWQGADLGTDLWRTLRLMRFVYLFGLMLFSLSLSVHSIFGRGVLTRDHTLTLSVHLMPPQRLGFFLLQKCRVESSQRRHFFGTSRISARWAQPRMLPGSQKPWLG